MMIFTAKDADETITVTFDFSVVAETLTIAVFSVSVISGHPDSAPLGILDGNLTISGALVMQRISGGQNGTTYRLRCLANDADGEIHVLTADLPVKSA